MSSNCSAITKFTRNYFTMHGPLQNSPSRVYWWYICKKSCNSLISINPISWWTVKGSVRGGAGASETSSRTKKLRYLATSGKRL